jgi:hypothetical protein
MKPTDTVRLDTPSDFGLPMEQSSVPGYVKHVRCEGARSHVLHWDSKGSHCSEKNCVINAPGRQPIKERM